MTIKYHFFGKECNINPPFNNQRGLQNNLIKKGFKNTNPVLFVNQIHSNKIVVIDSENKIYNSKSIPQADSIVTNLKNLSIAIRTADCAPIVFFDKKNKIIAATHAGWKGAFQNIMHNTIAQMLKIGAYINHIEVEIGPTIRQKSYEVSLEFYQKFLLQRVGNKKFFINSINDQHFMFDLAGYIKDVLIESGITTIYDNQIDTYSNKENFFSYRRSFHLKEVDCGRNICVINIDE